MKKLIIEIIIIIVVSTIIALFYNCVRTDGIPFIPKSKAELMVSDSLLFGDIFNDKQINENDNTVSEKDVSEKDMEQKTENNLIDTNTQIVQESTVSKEIETKIEEMDVATILRNVRKSSDDNYGIVSFEQMKKIVDSGNDNFIIVDSRREADYLKRHIPKAINIYANDEDAVVIEKILTLLPKDKTIIIYCDGGNCDLSHHIAALLENFGYSRFFIYEGGWNEWSKR